MPFHKFYLKPHELKQIEAAMHDERPLVRQRAKALYMAHHGSRMPEIAQEVGWANRSTVYRVIERWQDDGIDSLNNASKSGRPPLLSEADCHILEAVTVMKPSDFGLKQPGWTVEALNQVLREKTGILISDKSLRDALHKMGYSFQLVRQRGHSSSMSLPRTSAEFELYLAQLKQSSGTQRDFHTWNKAE